MISSDSLKSICSPASASGLTHSAALAGLTIEQSGQLHAHANLSARQAKALGLLTSGIYGRPSTTSPRSADLASVRRPRRIVGEQVASPDGAIWLDLVQTDMEALGYAFGACAFPAAGVGAPEVRDRTYWLADADDEGLEGRILLPQRGDQWAARSSSLVGGMADSYGDGQQTSSVAELHDYQHNAESRRGVSGLADTDSSGRYGQQVGELLGVRQAAGRFEGYGVVEPCSEGVHRQPTNGYWRDADWLGCTDAKWRPVEPGTFPLAHGSAPRVGRVRADQGHRAGRLKGYGNALNAEAAIAFIKSTM